MVVDILGGMLGLYKVVPVNEVHIRVMNNKKEIFSTKEKRPDGSSKSSYWKIPFITRLHELPLTNIRIDVPDVKLNDKNMAKYSCDVVCFVNITDPLLAAERTDITLLEDRYEARTFHIKNIAEDLRAIIESVGRTSSTKYTILDVYMDRNKIDDAVSIDVEKVFPKWGLQLVDLEIKDLKDISGSTIIADIERKIAAEINADARVKVATENKRATVIEAENLREAEMAKAKNEEEWRQRQILKEQNIAIAQQEKNLKEAERMQRANEQSVEAKRKLEVGTADVYRQRIEKESEADRLKLSIVAEGTAKQTLLVGKAEADIIKAKKVAEAEGIEKLALAQQQFNDAATTIEGIKAYRDIQLGYANAYKAAFDNATVNIVAGSTSEVLSGGLLGNVKLGPKEGASMQQFAATSGLSPQTILDFVKNMVPLKDNAENAESTSSAKKK